MPTSVQPLIRSAFFVALEDLNNLPIDASDTRFAFRHRAYEVYSERETSCHRYRRALRIISAYVWRSMQLVTGSLRKAKRLACSFALGDPYLLLVWFPFVSFFAVLCMSVYDAKCTANCRGALCVTYIHIDGITRAK